MAAPEDIATILRAAGIEIALAESTSVADAPQVADRIGYPLVAKVIAPGVTHKSDIGGVIMGLNSAIGVAEAAVTLADRARTAGAALEGVLLQREVRGGIEALVGVTTDPTFGPLVVCGLGGVMVELIHDVAFRLTPVTDIDAQEMMASLKTGRLLDGYSGAVQGDREALAAVFAARLRAGRGDSRVDRDGSKSGQGAAAGQGCGGGRCADAPASRAQAHLARHYADAIQVGRGEVLRSPSGQQ